MAKTKQEPRDLFIGDLDELLKLPKKEIVNRLMTAFAKAIVVYEQERRQVCSHEEHGVCCPRCGCEVVHGRYDYARGT